MQRRPEAFVYVVEPDLGEDLLGDPVPGGEAEGGGAALPAFLDEDEPVDADNDDDEDRAAAA